MRYWTHYWANPTVREHVRTGQHLRAGHTASGLFVARGVRAGDVIYVVTRFDGTISLLGMLEVTLIVDRFRAESLLGITGLWDAREHVIADNYWWLASDARIPHEQLGAVKFLDRNGRPRELKFERPDVIDRQSLRGVRR